MGFRLRTWTTVVVVIGSPPQEKVALGGTDHAETTATNDRLRPNSNQTRSHAPVSLRCGSPGQLFEDRADAIECRIDVLGFDGTETHQQSRTCGKGSR